MVIGSGNTDRSLSPSEVRGIVERSVATLDPRWRRILVLIPDGTRTMPLPPSSTCWTRRSAAGSMRSTTSSRSAHTGR